MEWKKAQKKDDGSIVIPDRWLHLHYYEALNILFRIENALRVFVYSVLKNELKEKWIDCNLEGDEGEHGTIKSIAKRRISQVSSFGYLGYNVTCPIMYLTGGELIRLITSDTYWKHFKPHFLGKKEIIRNKLDEIGTVRNALAHFRPIKDDDVDVIKQNAKHVLMAIESKLMQMLRSYIVVPTNTEEPWYSELSVLGTDLCTFRFFQSEDENWIRIVLTYKCPVIKINSGQRYMHYQVLNVISPAVIKQFPILSKLIIYLTEQVAYAFLDKEGNPVFSKNLWFVFSRQTLQESFVSVKESVQTLLTKISQESELIQQDNLARGEIIMSVSAYATLQERKDGSKYWSVDSKPLASHVKEGDPVEYWAQGVSFARDFIAGSHIYPWIPADISNPVPLF